MRQNVKQRIVGAVVLVALAVIFIPFLFTLEPPRPLDTGTLIPPAPDITAVTIDEPLRDGDMTPPKPIDEAFIPAESIAAAQSQTPVAVAPQENDTQNTAIQGKSASQKPTPAPVPVKKEERPALAEDTLEAWVIQVASLRDKKAADELNQRLRESGYKSYVRSVQAPGGLTHRVFVGPVSLRSRALDDKAAIDARFGVQSLVVSFEP